MKRLLCAVLVAACFAVPAAAQSGAASTTAPIAGKVLVDANGKYLGSIYKVAPDGSAQLVLEDRLVTIPASTISQTDGKFTTSLTKRDILKPR